MSPVRILISAGEASGEMYGAQLIEVLLRGNPSLEFFGVGGERMRAVGCNAVVDATFVGHPLAEVPHPAIERADYAAQYKLDPEKHWITLMPGSRVKEVRMNLPIMLEAAAQLGRAFEFLLPIAPTLDRNLLEGLV